VSESCHALEGQYSRREHDTTTGDSTDLSAIESEDPIPKAPEGIRNPTRPDDDDDQVEGHGAKMPLLPDDGSKDTEGHWGRLGG
jgi:hypothetical protein